MSYRITGGAVQPAANSIAAHNCTHRKVAALEIAAVTKPHYDGSEFDSTGVEQVLSSFYSAPTTFAESINVVEKAISLWDNQHTNQHNTGGTAGTFAHKVAGTTISGTVGPSGATLEQEMVTAWGPVLLEILTCLAGHASNGGGVWHVAADAVNDLGTLPSSITTKGELSRLGNLARYFYKAHIALGTTVHDVADTTHVITALAIADENDFDGMKALFIDLRTQLLAHEADVTSHIGSGGADVVNAPALAAAAFPTSVSTAFTRANLYKSTHNTDLASTTIHQSADGTNTIAASNATTIATYKTLAAEIYTDQTAHFRFAPVSAAQRGV